MKKERKPIINDTFDWFAVWFLGLFLFLFFLSVGRPLFAIFWNGGNAGWTESLDQLQEIFAEEENLRYPDLEELDAKDLRFYHEYKKGDPALPYTLCGTFETADGEVALRITAKKRSIGGAVLLPNETVGGVLARMVEKESVKSWAWFSEPAKEVKPAELYLTFFLDGYRYEVTAETQENVPTETKMEYIRTVAQNIIDQ